MDKNNNKKRKNLIQEFLTYTGSDPSTNEIIGFLAIKNAEYLAKNEANHGQFSKEERKDLYEFYNYFAEHFEKQTRDARLRNWVNTRSSSQPPCLLFWAAEMTGYCQMVF